MKMLREGSVPKSKEQSTGMNASDSWCKKTENCLQDLAVQMPLVSFTRRVAVKQGRQKSDWSRWNEQNMKE